MLYIKIGETLYPADRYSTIPADGAWDRREARQFTLNMTAPEALEIFVDGLDWSLVRQRNVIGADGETQTVTEIEEQGDFNVAGAITDNRDGTSTIKMGKVTAAEILAELEAAYDEQ